jgi:2-polyprenyl-6-hydroxyphenyl methylase/3-demethylubiquinone-9 3-methyltransferase
MSTSEPDMRFEFGKNWNRFVKRNFSEERLAIAKQRILDFAGLQSLEGFDFLDIGCGSGLHSYAALRAGANRVFSFDYDPNSVAATRSLRVRAGSPSNWAIEQGDVLDQARIKSLGQWRFVYSWGVLHHTGDMWHAIRSAQQTVARDGYFFIALYSADAAQSSMEFWIDKKREYNQASWAKKQAMVWWYIWRYGMQSDVRGVPAVVKQIIQYRFNRGMSYFTDVRDWLGGYPMEYAPDQAVVDLLEGECGFELVNVKTGEACSEFLFRRSGTPKERSVVTAIVARKKAAS